LEDKQATKKGGVVVPKKKRGTNAAKEKRGRLTRKQPGLPMRWEGRRKQAGERGAKKKEGENYHGGNSPLATKRGRVTPKRSLKTTARN